MRCPMHLRFPLAQLAKEQVEAIHAAALDILERFGVGVEDPQVADELAARGCVPLDNGRIRIPADVVERTLRDTPPELAVSAVNGETRTLRAGTLCTHSTGGAPWMLDTATGKRRAAATEDLVACIRVMNRMDMLDFPCSLLYPADMPDEITQFLQAAALFRHSEKPVFCPGVSTPGNARYIAELFRLIGPCGADGNPPGIVGISPQSPLFWPKEITDATRLLAETGVPVSILAAPMGGLTAPMTVAGCVAQCHAEILAFAVYCRSVRPTLPLLYGARCFFPNMRSGQTILGLPETGIAGGMSAQLAARIGLPSDIYGIAGGSCDFDEQTGYEKMLNGLIPALSGANMITGFGSMASVMGGSPEQLVVDNEIVAMIRRTLRRCAVGERALGLEALAAVIENGETFLEQEHTVDSLRDGEVFQPRLNFADSWQQRDEQPSLIAKAGGIVRDILSEEVRPVLRDDQEAELRKLIAAARREFGV